MRNAIAIAVLALLPLIAAAAGDPLGFNPEKHPEEALGMFVAPQNSLIFQMRQPDGSARDFERILHRPGILQSVRGWSGRFAGDKMIIKSGKDAKGGQIEYYFQDGRLVAFVRSGHEPVVFDYDAPRPSLPEEQSPLLRALMPPANAGKSAFKHEYSTKWKKSGRIQWPWANPNRSAMLYSEIALMAVWGILFALGLQKFPRPAKISIIAVASLLFAICTACLVWAGSRGAILGFMLGLAAFAFSRVELVRAALSRKVTWVVLALLAVAAVAWLTLGDTRFLVRGFKGASRWSNLVRLEIFHNAPMVIVDAPNGWGNADFSVGRAYVDWYQPLGVVGITGSLICDHLTRLAAWGWPMRFVYILAWGMILSMGVLCLKKDRNALPIAVWLAFGVTASFNPMFVEKWLWPVPLFALAQLLWFSVRNVVPCRKFVGVCAAAWSLVSVVVLALIWRTGTTMPRSEVKVWASPPHVCVKSQNPKTWIVDDGITLGGLLAWKDVRAYYKENPKANGVGCVRRLEDLPESGVKRLVLAGKRGDEWLRAISEGAIPQDRIPEEVVFISPPFPPDALPPPLHDLCRVTLVIGEFATWYHSDAYANAPKWVKVVPGMEMYIANWMAYALGAR